MPLERCDECGLDLRTVTPSDAKVALRSFPRRYRAALTGFDDDEDADALVRRRPPSGGWSALEYAAHVRDVVALYDHRITTALRHDGAEVESVDPDAYAEARRYNDQRVDDVLEAMAANVDRLVATADEIPDDGWQRTVIRDGEAVDVLWMVRQSVHEGSHHLRDVERVVQAVRGRPAERPEG